MGATNRKISETADIILLLISSSFMASQYCYSIEMKRAIQRHESGKAIVIPILIRPVDWKNAPFGKLQCLPSNAKAMSKWNDKDEGFHEISLGIRKTIEKFSEKYPKTDSQDNELETTKKTFNHVNSQSESPSLKGRISNIGPTDHNNSIKIKEVSTSRKKPPLVSWLMVTTLTKHRWWKRLGEFLSEDFPPNEIEFIILGAQDIDFSERAYKEGKKIASAYAFLEGAEERWENVVFVDAYQPEFNLYQSVNRLTSLAKGDILIYRDADCLLLQYRFTKYLVEKLLQNHLGILSVPSISNGHPFKPKKSDIVLENANYSGILLDSTVNGMAIAVLKEIEKVVGGRNENTPLLQYTNYCAKMAQMGF